MNAFAKHSATVGLAMVLFAGGTASAQPAAPSPQGPRDAAAPRPPEGQPPKGPRPQRQLGDGSMLKERLQARLEELDRVRARLAQGLEQLNGGASAGDLLRELGPLLRSTGRGEGPMRDDAAGEADPMRPLPGPGDAGQHGGPNGPRSSGEMRGPRPDGKGGPDGQGPAAMATPEEREAAMAAIREHAPELAKRFDAMMRMDPKMAQRFGSKLLPRVRDAMRLRESDPELLKLKFRELTNAAVIFDAVRSYRDTHKDASADQESARKSESDLRAALTEQYDLRRELLSREVDALSRRLEQMRADLKKSEQDKQASVDSLIEKVKDGKDLRELSPPGPPRDDRRPE